MRGGKSANYRRPPQKSLPFAEFAKFIQTAYNPLVLFKVAIKNFGKLADTTVRIGRFTVFAGANNTGKSFVSKALYSIFGAMNANHLAVVFRESMENLGGGLRKIARQKKISDDLLELAMSELRQLRDTINGIPHREDGDEFFNIESALPDIRGQLNQINKVSASLEAESKRSVKNRISEGATSEEMLQWAEAQDEDRAIKGIRKHVSHLLELAKEDPGYFIGNGLHSEIRNNLIRNFQVPVLQNLCSEENGRIEFHIDNVGNINIANDVVDFRITQSGIDQLQARSRVLYLESPVLSKFRKPLANIDKMPPWFLFDRKDQLTGVPKYFYDLENSLNISYPGNITFPKILEKLTCEDVLGGRVKRGETGNLFFQEQGREYPLHLAAMGVANLGILALLIEKNILNKDTFLFIDEPEAHLHPAWQVEMAEALFALAEGGVNVVIATHSADILKWLEVHLKENPQAEDMVALNHFRADGVNHNGGNVCEKLDTIQEELAHPYHQLYYRGV